MGTGILVCGLNGAGKSTVGAALAKELDFYFIDIEKLYFPKTGAPYIYAAPRTRQEVQQLLYDEIRAHENFVFASVKGDHGEAFRSFFRYAVLIHAPKDVRMQRVKNRSFQKFGSRMMPGGDLWEQEEKFFDLVRSRDESTVEEWVQSLRCPVIRVDGTRSVKENVKFVTEQIRNEMQRGESS